MRFFPADERCFVALDEEIGETLRRRDRSTRYGDEKGGLPVNSGDPGRPSALRFSSWWEIASG